MKTVKKENKPKKPLIEACAVTGVSGPDLVRKPFLGPSGKIIGYVYLSKNVIDNIKDYQIGVRVDWKYVDRKNNRKMKIYSPPARIIKE